MNTLLKITIGSVWAFAYLQLNAQQPISGTTTGVKGSTNFTGVANFEKANPGKIIQRKLPPDEAEDESEEHPDIINTVPAATPRFAGRTTIIPQPRQESVEGVQEFPCNNFRALDDDGNSFPPDVNGAVGFDHLMATMNTQVRIQNKQGGEVNTTSLTGFWNGLGGHTDIFDPKITYDPYDKRWFFVCCATRQAAGSALLLGVSETPDPTGGWTTYTIDADPADLYWFDYPSLGFNKNWITVGGYMFDLPNMSNTPRSRVWVINKSVVYAGNPNITVTYFDRTAYFHISPAVTYDANDNTQWLSTVYNSNFNNRGYLQLFSISGTQASPVFNDGSIVDVGAAWSGNGPAGPQLGSATGLDLGDHRILQSTFRAGTLWTGNNVFLPAASPTSCAAQVVAINTVTGTAIENIQTATSSTNMQAYPSISVNSTNDIFFGYSTFRNNAYVTSTISYRRNDGQGFFFYYFKTGEDSYVKTDASGKNRWGDYSATFIDPEDDRSAWTIQEYTRPKVGGTSFWGTWWAKICPGFCLNNLTLSGSNFNLMQKYEANLTITSTAQVQNNSTIRYDAGSRVTLSPGFKAAAGSNVKVFIDGCGGVR